VKESIYSTEKGRGRRGRDRKKKIIAQGIQS
jgi:hypothetical protein